MKTTKDKRYILTDDLIIPKGTILDIAPNSMGGKYYRHCYVAVGKDFTGHFTCTNDGIVSDSNGIIIEIVEPNTQ